MRSRARRQRANIPAPTAGAPATDPVEPHQQVGVVGRAVRDAERWLVAHAREAVTVEDAAAVVGLSVRALQAGFRRHLGTTPTERLREARLVGAHRELRAADPGATTASEVATAWGFGHLGRFASSYRARFGRAPREVLRT